MGFLVMLAHGAPAQLHMTQLGTCGAVAYTTTGIFGTAHGLKTCMEAIQLAIARCQSKTKTKADYHDCTQGPASAPNTWFQVQYCEDGVRHATHVIMAEREGELREHRFRIAMSSENPQARFNPASCRVLPKSRFHSGGLHEI